MKIKNDNEKEIPWGSKSRQALYSVFSTGSKWRFSISLFLNVVLILIVIAGFSLSMVTITESGENLVVNMLYKLNIEPSIVPLAVQGVKSENVRIPGHVVQGFLSNPDHISIDIKNNDFQRLSQQRDRAIEQGIWTGTNETVPATIRYRDEKIKVDVRLKGNSIDHWGTDAYSLKIKTDGEERLFGLREFSLQKPWTRNYLTEWVFHRFLAYEDVLHLQFSFVDVEINGKDMGIYALEESPDDHLLEVNGYPPGPVYHINDELWSERGSGYSVHDTLNPFPVELFNARYYNSNEELGLQARKGSDILEAFRNGDISTEQAFDEHTLATFLALSDLTGNRDGNSPSNLRPYYNPINSKLELIGDDANTQPIETIFYLDDRQFNQRISDDPRIVQQYVHELERVSEPGYLEHFFSVIDTDFKQNLSIIYKENPFYHFPREIYEHNRKIIRQTIYPYRCQYSYLENITPDGVVNIEAGAAQPMPVEVLGLRLNGKLLLPTGGSAVLPGNDISDVMHYQILSFNLSSEDRISGTDNLTLECRVFGTIPVRSEPVIAKPRLSDWPLGEDIVRRQPNPDQYPWLTRDDKNLTFTIQPGTWEVADDLILPEGYSVVSPENGSVRLDLTKGAMILSYSPLRLQGDTDTPFEVVSSDGTGQGIVILGAGNTSVFSYVRVSNLSVPNRNGWKIPASVTFYQSPVIIDHSEFLYGTKQGSLLSIVRGDAIISGSRFTDSEADLLTSSFSSVQITDSRFLGPAAQGITGTGSRIDVLDTFFNNSSGIGIRGMRNSYITIRNSYFSTTQVAGASEDGSTMILKGCSINSGLIGLAAYKNIPGYGPGKIIADNVQTVNTKIPFLSEKGSSININGSDIPASESRVFPGIEDITGISV